jgi:excisionase family DNA binding protein
MTTTHDYERPHGAGDRSQRDIDPILLTITEAATALAIGRTTVYELIGAGDLDVVHIGRSSRIPVDAIHAFIAAKRTSR